MCTVASLVRPTHLVLAANRDERLDRPWAPPAAYWPERPHTVAGRDRTARHLARFEATEPADDDIIAAWYATLADRLGESAEQTGVVPRGGFCMVCGSFVSLPATG